MDPSTLIMLAVALSLDSLTVGLLYGSRRIRLPWTALLIVSLATALLLGLAMTGGSAVAGALPPQLARRIGAMLLAGVGAWITYQTWRSHRGGDEGGLTRPRHTPGEEKRRAVLRLRFGSVGVVVEILREPGAADLDRSGHINPVEAIFLGIALALDSVAAGLGAAMAGYSPFGLPAAAAAGSFLMLLAGSRWAHYLPVRLEGRWAMVSGLVLCAVGLYRMIG